MKRNEMSIEQNEYDLMYKGKKNETNFSVCSRFQKQKNDIMIFIIYFIIPKDYVLDTVVSW